MDGCGILQGDLAVLRRDLHRIPEIGLDLRGRRKGQ